MDNIKNSSPEDNHLTDNLPEEQKETENPSEDKKEMAILKKQLAKQQKKIDALSDIVKASAGKADAVSGLVDEKIEALNIIKNVDMCVIENLGDPFRDSHVIIHRKEKCRISKAYAEYLKAEYNLHGEWFRTHKDDKKYGVAQLNPKATEHIKNQQIQSRAKSLDLTPSQFKESQKFYAKIEGAK